MSGPAPRLLVAEGNPRERIQRLADFGGATGSERYRSALTYLYPDAVVDIVEAAEADATLPAGSDLAAYDGVVIGGSALNVPGGDDDPMVQRQITFTKAVFDAGVPFLGSCWGLQLAAAAAGGRVAASRRGREVGFARKIAVTREGRGSLFFEGKSNVFDSPAIHYDEVTHLPPGGVVLAANSHCAIQAAAINFLGGSFWGMQYHPEFDLPHIAALMNCYAEAMAEEGFFADTEAARDFANRLEVLDQDPSRQDLAWLLGLDDDVLDPRIRYREIGNWVKRMVLPRMIRRG